MRIFRSAIVIVCVVGLGHLLKHYWGRAGQLWLVGTLLFLCFVLWIILKIGEKRLRDQGIEIPDDDE